MSEDDDAPDRHPARLQETGNRLAARKTAEYFAERSKHGDPAAFDRFMNRQGGQPPAPEDQWDPAG